MISLVIPYRANDRVDDAIRLVQSMIEILRRASGLTHPDTLNAMIQLAISYQVAGRTAEAIALEEESLRLKHQHLSPGDSWTIESIENLVTCCEESDRKAEAEVLRREAEALKAKAEGKQEQRSNLLRVLRIQGSGDTLTRGFVLENRFADGPLRSTRFEVHLAMREPSTYEILGWSSIAVWISATALVSTNTGVEGLVVWAYLIGVVLAAAALLKRRQSQVWLASVGLGVNSVFCLAALLYWRMD